jgi:hypothetical protein
MFLAEALDLLATAIFIALFVTQVFWPILWGRPLFPLWRAWRERRAAEKAWRGPKPALVFTHDKPEPPAAGPGGGSQPPTQDPTS